MSKRSSNPVMEFVKLHPPKPSGCWVCGLDNVADLNDAARKGVPYLILQRYLVEKCGLPVEEVTRGKLRYHFQEQKHHLRGAA